MQLALQKAIKELFSHEIHTRSLDPLVTAHGGLDKLVSDDGWRSNADAIRLLFLFSTLMIPIPRRDVWKE